MYLGDVHGSSGWFKRMARKARYLGCDAIVQLGDLGYGVGDDEDARLFPERIERQATKNGLNVFFLDGNHDSFDVLLDPSLPTVGTGFRQLSEHVFYLPRGLRWDWQGIRFLALGGAFSIDYESRLSWEENENTARVWWWPEERITQADFYRCLEGGPVDMMLAHDCPWGVAIPSLGEVIARDVNDVEEVNAVNQLNYRSMRNRQAVAAVVDHVRPLALLHGHWHIRYEGQYENRELDLRVKVNGLDRDGTHAESYLVVDLVELAADVRRLRAGAFALPA